jgi:hypothetical protein
VAAGDRRGHLRGDRGHRGLTSRDARKPPYGARPYGGVSVGGVLPEGQSEADNGDQGGDGRERPPGAFEVVESLVVVSELPVGLVAALYEQGERSVDAGEPFGHGAA